MNGDCVELAVVDAHGERSDVLRHDYYRRGPLGSCRFDDFCLPYSFDLFSHEFSGLLSSPIR